MSDSGGDVLYALLVFIIVIIKICLCYSRCSRQCSDISETERPQVIHVRRCQLPSTNSETHFRPLIVSQDGNAQKNNSVPPVLFALGKNENGEMNKRLYVYTSEAKIFVYEYFWVRENLYLCENCRKQKAFVIATIFIYANGEKFIKFGPVKHVCAPIPTSEMFKVKINNNSLMDID